MVGAGSRARRRSSARSACGRRRPGPRPLPRRGRRPGRRRPGARRGGCVRRPLSDADAHGDTDVDGHGYPYGDPGQVAALADHADLDVEDDEADADAGRHEPGRGGVARPSRRPPPSSACRRPIPLVAPAGHARPDARLESQTFAGTLGTVRRTPGRDRGAGAGRRRGGAGFDGLGDRLPERGEAAGPRGPVTPPGGVRRVPTSEFEEFWMEAESKLTGCVERRAAAASAALGDPGHGRRPDHPFYAGNTPSEPAAPPAPPAMPPPAHGGGAPAGRPADPARPGPAGFASPPP